MLLVTAKPAFRKPDATRCVHTRMYSGTVPTSSMRPLPLPSKPAPPDVDGGLAVVAGQRPEAVLEAQEGGAHRSLLGDETAHAGASDQLLTLEHRRDQQADDHEHDRDFDEREAAGSPGHEPACYGDSGLEIGKGRTAGSVRPHSESDGLEQAGRRRSWFRPR